MDANNPDVVPHPEKDHVQNIKLHECLSGTNMQSEYIMLRKVGESQNSYQNVMNRSAKSDFSYGFVLYHTSKKDQLPGVPLRQQPWMQIIQMLYIML